MSSIPRRPNAPDSTTDSRDSSRLRVPKDHIRSHSAESDSSDSSTDRSSSSSASHRKLPVQLAPVSKPLNPISIFHKKKRPPIGIYERIEENLPIDINYLDCGNLRFWVFDDFGFYIPQDDPLARFETFGRREKVEKWLRQETDCRRQVKDVFLEVKKLEVESARLRHACKVPDRAVVSAPL